MNILPTLGILIVLIFFLVKSADLLESAFVGISKKLKVNAFVTGFLLLAFTSSLPETFVAINAGIGGYSGLSVGNLIGATIILLTLVIGISAVKNKSIPFKGVYSTKEVLISLAIIYAQILALIDGKLEWVEGVILLSLYTGFIVYLVGKGKVLDLSIAKGGGKLSAIIIKAMIGVLGLIIASNLTVTYSIQLAEVINIPPILIGLLGISIGTNLPEIVILFRSRGKEGNNLAAGNFIGSATLNTAVLGLLILLRPTVLVNFLSLIPALIALSITIFMFSLMVINDRAITRKEGYILLLIFLSYILAEFIINF